MPVPNLTLCRFSDAFFPLSQAQEPDLLMISIIFQIQMNSNPSPPPLSQAQDPDLIVICPCGLDLPTGLQEAAQLRQQGWW